MFRSSKRLSCTDAVKQAGVIAYRLRLVRLASARVQHLFLLILMAGKEPNLAWADAARSLACVVVLTLSTALQGWVGDGLQLNMAFWGLMSLQAAST